MKRIGFLYGKLCSKDNIREAIIRSSKGKRNRKEVIKIINNIEYYVEEIEKLLVNKTYNPKNYQVHIIYDKMNKKNREIYKPAYYPDQIIHYCLMNILEPIILPKMYKYSCGSIPEKGTHFGKNNLRKWLDSDPKNTKYCIKMDIRKFYPSINKNKLISKFERIIKDKDLLWLLKTIININTTGVPIGFYTSGWFSNFYLNDLDNEIKKYCKYYIRYVDDIIIFSSRKKELHRLFKIIENKLGDDDLSIKHNYQLFNTKIRDIDFLGFRFFQNKTIIRKRIMYNITRKLRKKLTLKNAQALISYFGWIKCTNSYNFYNNYFKKYYSIGYLKNYVSRMNKIYQYST